MFLFSALYVLSLPSTKGKRKANIFLATKKKERKRSVFFHFPYFAAATTGNE